jgi:hypothetical protein
VALIFVLMPPRDRLSIPILPACAGRGLTRTNDGWSRSSATPDRLRAPVRRGCRSERPSAGDLDSQHRAAFALRSLTIAMGGAWCRKTPRRERAHFGRSPGASCASLLVSLVVNCSRCGVPADRRMSGEKRRSSARGVIELRKTTRIHNRSTAGVSIGIGILRSATEHRMPPLAAWTRPERWRRCAAYSGPSRFARRSLGQERPDGKVVAQRPKARRTKSSAAARRLRMCCGGQFRPSRSPRPACFRRRWPAGRSWRGVRD